MFFLLVFSSPSLTLFKIGQFLFISSLSLTFPEFVQCFFYLVALINFSENSWNVFFSQMFFLPPSLFRFSIFSDLKQRNKNQWPKPDNPDSLTQLE